MAPQTNRPIDTFLMVGELDSFGKHRLSVLIAESPSLLERKALLSLLYSIAWIIIYFLKDKEVDQ